MLSAISNNCEICASIDIYVHILDLIVVENVLKMMNSLHNIGYFENPSEIGNLFPNFTEVHHWIDDSMDGIQFQCI